MAVLSKMSVIKSFVMMLKEEVLFNNPTVGSVPAVGIMLINFTIIEPSF
jgi:hypothetical protein